MNIDNEMFEILCDELEEYNTAIAEVDFTRPYSSIAYCIYQGVFIYAEEYDLWFIEQGYETPRKAAMKMIEGHLDSMKEVRRREKEERMRKREQLRQAILSDKNFHKCTNKELRRLYINDLDRIFTGARGLFYSERYGMYDIPLSAFIESIWRDFKNGDTI